MDATFSISVFRALHVNPQRDAPGWDFGDIPRVNHLRVLILRGLIHQQRLPFGRFIAQAVFQAPAPQIVRRVHHHVNIQRIDRQRVAVLHRREQEGRPGVAQLAIALRHEKNRVIKAVIGCPVAAFFGFAQPLARKFIAHIHGDFFIDVIRTGGRGAQAGPGIHRHALPQVVITAGRELVVGKQFGALVRAPF